MKRRTFIGQALTGAAAFTIIPRHVMGGQNFLAPSDRINLGYIGNGRQCLGLLNSLNACPETLAIACCDVDTKKLDRFVRLGEAANASKVKSPLKGFHDYRELLARKDIDAVVIATPDHWHAQIAIDAAKAGKDIYCEKPMSLTIAEGRAMVKATRKYNRVFQTGSMQRSMFNFRQAAELVLNGYVGEITEINVSVGEPSKQCDLPSMPIPDYLDWNLWIGPSLYRGYNPILSPPIEENAWAWWRGYRGFGGGYITDWGAHMFDIVQWAMGMDESGPIAFIPPDIPATTGLKYIYSNGVTVHHKAWGENNAIQFIGKEGKIEVSRGFLRTNPANLADIKMKRTDKSVYYSDNHHADWINSIKKRTRPIADVEIGHRTATVCNAINIAYELQRPLKWNPKTELFSETSANLMVGRPYRGQWDYQKF